MLSTNTLRVLPGGLREGEERPPLPHYASTLVGVARVKTVQEDPDIKKKLKAVHKTFGYLPGHFVGIIDTSNYLWSVDWPRINKDSIWTVGMPATLFSLFISVSENRFTDPDEIQHDLQEQCLMGDRVTAIRSSLSRWKRAVKPGMDRHAALVWAAGPNGHNNCEVCEKPILRHVFDDAECNHLGPVRQRCQDHIEE